MRRTVFPLLLSLSCGLPLLAQSLEVASGNGQIVLEYFKTQEFMQVRARDQFSRPLSGVFVNFTVSSGQGSLVDVSNTTDSDGIARAKFLATAVPGGNSIQQSTVRADSNVGSALFYVTTALSRLPGGGGAGALPLVQLVKPSLEETGRTISGDAGSTITGAVVVRVAVQVGPETGSPIPNVGVRIQPTGDPSFSPAASCRSNNGMVLTDATGTATCDLVLNNVTGQNTITAIVGEVNQTPDMTLNIRTAIPCTFTLQPATKAFPSTGGQDFFGLTANSATCAWNVTSNVPWVQPTGTLSGSGSATITYSVLTNTGLAREGRISVGGQTFLVTQAAAGTTGALTITTPSILPAAITAQVYNFPLIASGGRSPYRWSAGYGVPDGLSLSLDGRLTGTPIRAGDFTFPVAVFDSAGSTYVRDFSLKVSNVVQSGDLVISPGAFPAGTAGIAYRQVVSVANACSSLVSVPQFRIVSGVLPQGLTLRQEGATWVIDGTPSQTGAFTFSLGVTDPCGRSASSSYVLNIAAQAGGGGGNPIPGGFPISFSSSTLNFSVLAGTQVSPVDQSVFLNGGSQQVSYNASATTANGRQWLVIRSGSAGTTPAFVTVGVQDFRDFAPGIYTGTIQVTSPGASAPAAITVNLEVRPSTFTTLLVTPTSLTFNLVQSFFPVTDLARQTLRVTQPEGAQVRVEWRYTSGNVGQQWLRATPAALTAPNTIDVTANQQGLSPGSYTAEIVITPVTGGTATIIPVSMIVVNQPQFVFSPSGLSFSVSSLDPAPAAQTVNLSTSLPVRVNVTAPTISGGTWLKVTPSTGTTPMALSVSVDPTGLRAGSYNGEIVVRAADNTNIPASSIRVILIVTETTPTITSVTHAASGVTGPLAPGSWAVINGTFLANSSDGVPFKVTDGKVDTTLAEARFLVDGVPAPIISASSRQATIQMPYGIATKDRVAIVAEFRGVRSEAYVVPTLLINPALFVTEGTQGWITNQDGTANRMGNGAAPGAEVIIYGTGEGLTDPAGVDGAIAGDNPPKPTLAPVQVWLDGKEAEVLSYGGVPGQPAGLFHVRVKVPADVTRGVPVNVTVGIAGNYTPDLVTLATLPPPNQDDPQE